MNNSKQNYINNTKPVTRSLRHFVTILRNVTNNMQNGQLSAVTCFIIHVGLECIGEKTYA